MGSTVIFDVATKPFPWQPILSSAGALVFGCVLLLVNRFWRGAPSRIFGYFMIVCALVCIVYYPVGWHFSQKKRVKSLVSGHYEVLQGRVENFRPMPDDESSGESFTISGHMFSYSDSDAFEMTACFNQTAPHGSPIHAGMMLRVKFSDQCILQIEELPQNQSSGHN